MVLYLVGLGLADEKDITLRGLEAVRSSKRVYLEAYTSILMLPDNKALEELYGRPILMAHRETVELEADDILADASGDSNVSFCVVGDPLSATTHTDLVLRARKAGVQVRVIHNASIMTALASSGLQAYNFGQTVSVPFWGNWKPDSWLPRIEENMQHGMHTLVLGDIKVREQSEEDMARGIERYQPPRYMLIPQLISQLLSASRNHATASSGADGILSPDKTLAIALCRMGTDSEGIYSGTLAELLALASPTPAELAADEAADDADELASEAELDVRRAKRAEERAEKAFGKPLHSLVIVGSRVHHLEMLYAAMYKVEGSRWDEVARDVYGIRE